MRPDAPRLRPVWPLVAALAACSGRGPDQTNVSGGDGRVVKLDGGTPSSTGGSGGGQGGGAGGSGGDDKRAAIVAACTACEKQQCTTDDFIGIDNVDYYALCYAATGTATTGPARGKSLADLCKAVVDCVHRTGCGIGPDGSNTTQDCYCGAGVSSAACLGGVVQGPCRTEIENAAETTVPQEVVLNAYSSTAYPAGLALWLIRRCETDSEHLANPAWPAAPCTTACLAGGDSDGGVATGGAGGTGGGGNGGNGGSTGASGAGGASAGLISAPGEAGAVVSTLVTTSTSRGWNGRTTL